MKKSEPNQPPLSLRNKRNGQNKNGIRLLFLVVMLSTLIVFEGKQLYVYSSSLTTDEIIEVASRAFIPDHEKSGDNAYENDMQSKNDEKVDNNASVNPSMTMVNHHQLTNPSIIPSDEKTMKAQPESMTAKVAVDTATTILQSQSSQPESTTTITTSVGTHKPRILLGIWLRSNIVQANQIKKEARRERVLRHTYLEMDYRYKSNDTVCFYNQMLLENANYHNPNESCRLVYVYIRTEKARLRPSQTYLKVKKVEGKKQNANPNAAMAEWFNWAKQTQEKQQNIIGDIDYVAFSTTEALILPKRFWNENKMFGQSNQSPSFGFLPDPNCTTSSTATTTSENSTTATDYCFDPHFVCLSRDLANLAANQTEVVPRSVPHINHLYHTLREQTKAKDIQAVPMNGVASVPISIIGTRTWAEYVKTSHSFLMDPYEEAQVRQKTKVTSFRGQPRILVGLFSTLSEKDKARRQALRETYLQHYVKSTDTPHRICSISQLLQKEVREEDCQYAYTFVVGANPSGMFSYFSTNIDGYTVRNSNITEDAEEDVLYLNIRENMNEGKSDTWFRYATLLSESLYFDYHAKVDSDTLVYPPKFFSFMSTWPAFPNNVRIYGGRYIIWERHRNAYGHTYMAGHLYWMSPDLARFMGFSRMVNRTELCSDMEDMTSGSYVNKIPNLIQYIELDESVADHGGKLKRAKMIRQTYADYLNKTRISAS